ncbi:LLM class flavin-dependent oxidoreductase [Nocardioides sp. B-3]|uniref:LLM class flavin-dependent oxidoreductase n=1 Tax=Nocardioides sp. B-3 TaxID=2895565 RepID=UPI0021522926|nr:LLM class flavin-dependent oxidoreductase [Nocardioides sp. B-3]
MGSLEEEFSLLGASFADRGARADEAISALRGSLSQRVPSFHGEHYDYDGLVVSPAASRERVPLWIGGRTLRSLRRATSYGDGWVPFGLNPEQLRDLLGKVELPDGFNVVLSAGRQLDPIGDPSRAERVLAGLRDAGATIAGVALAAESVDHYCEQLAALAVLGDKVE